jgi:hypothetical protein
MRVLSSISRRRGGLRHRTAARVPGWRNMMATIRALEPAGPAAHVATLHDLKSLFSREFRQGDRN